MIEADLPSFTFRCDLCGALGLSESPHYPPPGFAAIDMRPKAGVGVTSHACIGTCLVRAAMRLSGAARRTPTEPAGS